MRVSEIMTSPVLGVEPSASVADAAKLMLGSHVSGLPVVTSDGHLVGIVTEGDFMRRGELGTTRKRPRWLQFFISPGKDAEEYVQSHGRRVQEVMSPEPVAISAEASLADLVELMIARKIKRVPVVDKDKLVGIVARSDLMRAMLRAIPASAPAANDDNRIRQAIAAELAKQPWSNAIRVEVDHGIAELSGAIFDERAREAARVVAENVPGVKNVKDQLAWIEPLSGIYILPESSNQA
ncbi:CBS domain-containing protein [Bosea thiooxidans]